MPLPSSAFLAASVDEHFVQLTLADLHPVPTLTAGRLATTLPPPSRPRAGIFAPHNVGNAAWEFPSSTAGAESVP